MSVFLSLLSLCSVTLICCLIISADVSGRFCLDCAKDWENTGLPDPSRSLGEPRGEAGLEPHELVLLEVIERLNIFNPKALFTLLVGAIPTPDPFLGEPCFEKIPWSWSWPSVEDEWNESVVRPPKPGEERHDVKKISYAAMQRSSWSRPWMWLPKGHARWSAVEVSTVSCGMLYVRVQVDEGRNSYQQPPDNFFIYTYDQCILQIVLINICFCG